MKKFLVTLLAVFFVMSLGFCSSEEVKDAPKDATVTEPAKTEPAKDAKTPAKTPTKAPAKKGK